jgi:hypothetical protein
VPQKRKVSRHSTTALPTAPIQIAEANVLRCPATDSVVQKRWPIASPSSRNDAVYTVKIDQFAVERALETLVDRPVDFPITFSASLPLNAGAARDRVRLLLTIAQLQPGSPVAR